MKVKKYYVTMIDKFMSNWGMSKNRNNKLVFECETMNDAFIIEENAKNRNDMKYINIRETKPYYNQNKYFVQYKTIDDYPNWYEKDYFKKKEC